jgi:diaminohydroxyphosphoribosylaminopyrimidine deaminase / 5-amino-6-(5-phosphoribosylamino)uracil reductase
MFDIADRRFMKRALTLAEKGLGLSSPNPSVGCVIVREGKIVGRGLHEYALRDHAEIQALHEAGELSRNATAYVTLEPCCHQGRTPPCVDRLIQSGIRRVVVGRTDPYPKVSGRGIEILRSAGIQVDAGLMSEEAGKIIEPFACHVTTGLPFVVSKAGMSLDGKIGTGWPEGRWINSSKGREFGQYLRLCADAVLVGIGTILFDDPELTYRAKTRKARPLLRVILDTRLRTPSDARIFKANPQGSILIFCGHEASQSRQTELESLGAEIIRIPCSGKDLDLQAVLQELGKRGVLELLVEGGSQVHWSFLSQRKVDCFFFIIAPLVLGGKNSVPSIGGEGYRAVEESPKFRIRKSIFMGSDMVLETYPSYSRSIISPWLSPESVASGERDSEPSLKPK